MTAAEALWLDLTLEQVRQLTRTSYLNASEVTRVQGVRLQQLMIAHPHALTTTEALARQGVTLDEWLAS